MSKRKASRLPRGFSSVIAIDDMSVVTARGERYTPKGIDLRFLQLLNVSLRGGPQAEITETLAASPPKQSPTQHAGDC